MNYYLPLLITLILIIVIGVGLFLLHQYVEHKVNQDYKKLPTSVKVGSGKNMRNCPKGCIRGTCKYNPKCKNHLGAHPECCAFDFQCQYCRDKNGEYYLKPGNNPYIDANYYQPGKMTSTSELNRAIGEQNEYIFKLNKNIRKKNEEIRRRKRPFSKF